MARVLLLGRYGKRPASSHRRRTDPAALELATESEGSLRGDSHSPAVGNGARGDGAIPGILRIGRSGQLLVPSGGNRGLRAETRRRGGGLRFAGAICREAAARLARDSLTR